MKKKYGHIINLTKLANIQQEEQMDWKDIFFTFVSVLTQEIPGATISRKIFRIKPRVWRMVYIVTSPLPYTGVLYDEELHEKTEKFWEEVLRSGVENLMEVEAFTFIHDTPDVLSGSSSDILYTLNGEQDDLYVGDVYIGEDSDSENFGLVQLSINAPSYIKMLSNTAEYFSEEVFKQDLIDYANEPREVSVDIKLPFLDWHKAMFTFEGKVDYPDYLYKKMKKIKGDERVLIN